MGQTGHVHGMVCNPKVEVSLPNFLMFIVLLLEEDQKGSPQRGIHEKAKFPLF